jgi:glycosyltransferase involved in cell wall biosynthesis
MTRLRVPGSLEWELLVVNNNCTDRTDDVVAGFAGRLPIRGLYEAEPGLSNARNRALLEATGDYILWTDDDVLVDPDWLAAYARAFERHREGVFFGGPIRPWFALARPRWLKRVWSTVAQAYAVRELGDEPIRFENGTSLPFGANFALRTTEQRAHAFDPRFGRKGGEMLGGEEIAVLRLLLSKGHCGWWVPDAPVRHFIPPERMTVRFLRSYYTGSGEWLAMERMDEAASRGPRLLGGPRWLWRRALTLEASYRLKRLVSSPEVWIKDLIDASIAWGALAAYRSSSRTGGLGRAGRASS